LGRFPAQTRDLFPLAPALLLLFRPISGLPPHARQPAPHSASLSLTGQPHLPAALSRAPAPTGRPAPPVSHFVVLPAYGSPRSPPAITSVPSSVFSPHREVGHRPVLAAAAASLHGTAAVRSRHRRCAALTPVRCASPAPWSSVAPLPSGAYKRAAPSSSFPAPASATPLLPRPSSIRGRAVAVLFLPGEPFPLFSLPLCWSIKRLLKPPSFATPPRTQYTTSPRFLAQSSPTATPPRSSATSPRTPPSLPPLAELSPPLGPPDPHQARATAHCPRTDPPAENRRQGHRRPVFLPTNGRFAPHRRPLAPSSPPALSVVWAPRRRHFPSRPRRLPALGR
jgi:hypothetical protein